MQTYVCKHDGVHDRLKRMHALVELTPVAQALLVPLWIIIYIYPLLLLLLLLGSFSAFVDWAHDDPGGAMCSLDVHAVPEFSPIPPGCQVC